MVKSGRVIRLATFVAVAVAVRCKGCLFTVQSLWEEVPFDHRSYQVFLILTLFFCFAQLLFFGRL